MRSQPPTLPSHRRPKGDKRDRTKAKLLQAAMELIRAKGFEKTTLAQVAERAGVTTGSIYGNFRNRDELFMAVAEIKNAPIAPRIWPGMTFADLMGAMSEAVITAIPQRRSAILGALSFHSYALTHEELRTRVLEATMEIYREASASLALFPREDLPMAPSILVPVLHALTEGLLLQRFMTPELVPDEVIHAAFAALARKQSNGAA
jgi:AcrR family transcriptional regulator